MKARPHWPYTSGNVTKVLDSKRIPFSHLAGSARSKSVDSLTYRKSMEGVQRIPISSSQKVKALPSEKHKKKAKRAKGRTCYD